MIERSCSIAKAIKGADRIVLATGDLPENEIMRPYVERTGVEFFVGGEENVLERFYHLACQYKGKYLVRMTCDNYLIQPEVIEGLHDFANKEDADYAYISPLSHYSGEVVKCDAIKECFEQGFSSEANEHVTWDIRNNPQKKIVSLPADYLGLDHSNSVTLDTLDDLVLLKKLEMNYPTLGEPRCLEALRKIEKNLLSLKS